MRTLVLLALVGSLCACRQVEEPSSTDERSGVFVTNYPLEYFAKRIAGDAVPITFPVPPDVDPAFWMPGDEEIAAMQRADRILLNGATYEKWLDKVSLPADVLVVTSKAFEDSYRELSVAITHSHGGGGAHSHTGTDFNTWLDPELARQQAQAILETLKELAPEHAETFASNAKKLDEELEALGEEFGELGLELDDVGDVPLFASHPVYGYLAHRYEWRLDAMLWEPDAMPPEEEWKELAEMHEFHPARWMIYEDEPLPEIREKLNELGIEAVVFRTCNNRPETGDYFTEMRAGIERLRTVFQP